MFIPPGFSQVTPYIFAADAVTLIDFIVAAFGAAEQQRSLRPDGRVANSIVRIGDSMVMVTDGDERYPARPAAYYLYVEDADDSMAKAIAAGATLEMPVSDMPYGDRQGGVVDPVGNIWWISQRLEEGPYADSKQEA